MTDEITDVKIMKSRRKALGLLLGAPLLAPTAIAQKKLQDKNAKERPIALLIEENGSLHSGSKPLYLSRDNGDYLIIINLHKTDTYWFYFENSQFQKGKCITVSHCSFEELKLVTNPKLDTYKYTYGVGTKCLKNGEIRPSSGGELIIEA
jgi:hypothetical protein